jgi:hypothetical protein
MIDMGEEEGIRSAIDAYLNAIKTGEAKHFEEAFYPDSMVINADANTSLSEFVGRVRGRHDAGEVLEEIPVKTSINYVGDVANVRLDFELRMGDKTHYGTDYFNMVKRDGQWKISQKIYHITHSD